MANTFVSVLPMSKRLGPLSVRQINTRLTTKIEPLAPLAPKRAVAKMMIGNGRYKSAGRYPLAMVGMSSNDITQAATRKTAPKAASRWRSVMIENHLASSIIIATGPSVRLQRALDAYQRAQYTP